MKSILSFLSAVIAVCTGCQPTSVAPAPISSAQPAEVIAHSAAIWVAVDDPGELRSPPQVFQMADQKVIPNLKKLPGVKEVRLVGSEKQLAISDDIPTALIQVTLQGEASAKEFLQAFTKMESLPVAVNVVLDETEDAFLTVELLAEGSNSPKTRETAVRATEIVQNLPDVAGVVTYFETEKPNAAALLVKQEGDKPTVAEVRRVLEQELKGVKIGVAEKPAAK